jgi:hypothetical protein
VLFIAILYQLSLTNNASNKGFKRKFYPHPVLSSSNVDLGTDSLYIAGTSYSSIYLSNYLNASQLIIIDTNFAVLKKTAVHIPDTLKYRKQSTMVAIDSSRFFIMDGYSPNLLVGDLASLEIISDLHDTLFFNQGIAGFRQDFLFRIYDTKLKQNILVRINPQLSLFYTNRFILNKQVDGVFCTDGSMQYNKAQKKYIYVYYLQNRFIVLDTSLQLLATVKTIDTNSQAKIKVGYISTNTKTIVTPTYYSNRLSYAEGDHLFIFSGARADNDEAYMYNKSSVIDVYSLSEKRYLFSFYIPDYNKSKISSFIVYHGSLYVVQGTALSYFKLKTGML